MSPRVRPSALVLLGVSLTVATVPADEKLAGIACRSVHLSFSAPESPLFFNEVTVERSALGTYFCVCGFNQGYLGLQELGDGKKVVIFSVWDPGRQDDPDSVDPEERVKLVSKDEKVRIGRFGNEGTGGQSFLDLDWNPGQTYRFLVGARRDGERTAYSAYIAPPDARTWRHLATFSTITHGKLIGGYYSFIEDFRRDKVSATIERRAKFGEAWAQSGDGRWLDLAKATFTADANPSQAIDAGVQGGRFFLETGGKVENAHVRLGSSMELRPPGPPRVDRPGRIPALP